MRGNTFGKMFSITSFGESHGKAIGVVIDGVPSNLNFSLEKLQECLDLRSPGRLKGTTNRNESDLAIVNSGIFEGKTLGTPINILIQNTNQRSSDYDKLKTEYRPGHADKTTMLKYGVRDHRGGGRASGRETIARVIGGYFASLIIPNVLVKAYSKTIGRFGMENLSFNSTEKNTILQISDLKLNRYGFNNVSNNTELESEIENYLVELKKKGDSVGGVVEVLIENCPFGLGEPCFDKLKADLAKSLMSIGGCVAFSYGSGFDLAFLSGKDVSAEKHHFGGIEGGISNGENIKLNCVFKPTSTIGDKATSGRHDPCIVPRAIFVVESMVKIVLADHFLRQKAYSL